MSIEENYSEFEKYILGTMLINGHIVPEIVSVLSKSHFCLGQHPKVFQLMADMAERGDTIDIVTVTDEVLKRKDIDYREYNLLTDMASPTASMPFYCKKLIEGKARRDARQILQDGLSKIEYGEGPAEVVRSSMSKLGNIPSGTQENEWDDYLSLATEAGQDVFNRRQYGLGVGISTGFPSLDDYLGGGLKRGKLYIIGARPAIGKSTLGLQIAESVAMLGKAVAFFSLEMAGKEQALRSIVNRAEIDAARVERGKVSHEEMDVINILSKSFDLPIYVCRELNVQSSSLLARCQRLQKSKGLGLVMVDHVALLKVTGGLNEVDKLNQVTRDLKMIAMELNVPVIALAQVSREAEKGADHTPRLNNLKGSSSLEQDADVVMLIHRPEKYAPDERPNEADIRIEKNRSGRCGRVTLFFQGQFNRFLELNDERIPPKERVFIKGPIGQRPSTPPIGMDEL